MHGVVLACMQYNAAADGSVVLRVYIYARGPYYLHTDRADISGALCALGI